MIGWSIVPASAGVDSRRNPRTALRMYRASVLSPWFDDGQTLTILGRLPSLAAYLRTQGAARPGARFSTPFLVEANPGDRHAAVDCLTHVVDGQRRRTDGCQ